MALASEFEAVDTPEEAPRRGSSLVARGGRLIVGVAALAVGSAVLFTAPVLASPGCSGPVMMVEAIVLPDLSRTT